MGIQMRRGGGGRIRLMKQKIICLSDACKHRRFSSWQLNGTNDASNQGEGIER